MVVPIVVPSVVPMVMVVPSVPGVPKLLLEGGGPTVGRGGAVPATPGLLVGLVGAPKWLDGGGCVVGRSVDTSTCTQWSGVVSRSATSRRR